MKTIKQISLGNCHCIACTTRYDTLKDVLGLIDEIEEVCVNATEPGWSKARIFEELKARITGDEIK